LAIINLIKGFLIGVALVIPGLSGSIFAVIVGLYEPLIKAINQFRQSPKKQLQFLTPIGLGAIVGILFSTKVVLWLSQRFPIPAYAFFLGLVLGIIPFIWRKMRAIAFTWWYPVITLLGFALILGLTQLGSGQAESYISIKALQTWQDAGQMLFAGGFSVALMIIPGISGSIMLMVISQYGTVYNAVGAIVDLLRHLLKGNLAAAQGDLQTVALMLPFMVGALVGTVLIAKLMHYLLKHYESQVYYGVLGVVGAAAIILWQSGITPYLPKTGWLNLMQLALLGLMLLLGILATLFLDKPSSD
jgi:putative membrane protein